jgi:uncharacterized membrane protein YbhN (UPF0104 family)
MTSSGGRQKSGNRWLRLAPTLVGLGLLVAAFFGVRHELRHLHPYDIRRALAAIPRRTEILAAGLTVVSYGLLTFYDRLATIYAGHKVSTARVAFASFCAYALAHSLGVPALSGAAVRLRLYALWGLTPVQIGKVIGFCGLTFGLGALVLGGTVLVAEPSTVPLAGGHIPTWALRGIGVLLYATVGAYATLARIAGRLRLFGNEFELPGLRMAFAQILLATVDVALTSAIFYVLLPAAPGLTFLRFLGVYIASYSAGLIANVPGGLGVFDTGMLLGLAPWLDAPAVVSGILIFRLYYYVIPLFLAGAMFAGHEALVRSRAFAGRPATSTGEGWMQPDMAVGLIAGLVALAAALLLSLGALEHSQAVGRAGFDVATLLFGASQFAPSLLGAVLLVLALALNGRVRLAWQASIVLLLAAAALAWSQGEPAWIVMWLLATACLIAPFGPLFVRRARLLAGPIDAPTALSLMTLAAGIGALATVAERVRRFAHAGIGQGQGSFWGVVASDDIPQGVRASVLLATVIALVALWRLVRPARVAHDSWNSTTAARFAALGGSEPDDAEGIVWGEAGRAAIAFRRRGRVLLGLGDPRGAAEDGASALRRLRDLAVQEGRDLAVLDAGHALAPVFGELGLVLLPLDGEGFPGSYLACAAERDLKTLLPLLHEKRV